MLSALETEMKFQSIKNQSEGWVIHLYPSMLQNGILLKLGFSENGEAKCTVAARFVQTNYYIILFVITRFTYILYIRVKDFESIMSICKLMYMIN